MPSVQQLLPVTVWRTDRVKIVISRLSSDWAYCSNIGFDRTSTPETLSGLHAHKGSKVMFATHCLFTAGLSVWTHLEKTSLTSTILPPGEGWQAERNRLSTSIVCSSRLLKSVLIPLDYAAEETVPNCWSKRQETVSQRTCQKSTVAGTSSVAVDVARAHLTQTGTCQCRGSQTCGGGSFKPALCVWKRVRFSQAHVQEFRI